MVSPMPTNERERNDSTLAVLDTAILAALPDAVALVDTAGRIITINAAAERLFGYGAAEVLGEPVDALAAESGRSILATAWAASPAQGRRGADSTPLRLNGRRKDGSELALDVSLCPAGDGIAALVVVIFRDVSGEEHAEVERQRLIRERAMHQDANRMKDEFLAVLSHELRTPLNSIIGWTTVLRSSAERRTSEAERALDTIQRNARVLVRLIEDLLDISRIVSGHLRIEPRHVDLVQLLSGVVDNLRPAARAKGVTLTFDLPDTAVFVMGDPDRLQQVANNLLTNAMKFTPAAGVVTVGVGRAGRVARVQVRDTGVGITPEFLPHVFDRFRQADRNGSRNQSGLGLGLAIVRSVVELHGGTVHAESEGPQCGAAFTVELPLSRHTSARDESDDPTRARRRGAG
jgi:PAS domain S-box-containing protein